MLGGLQSGKSRRTEGIENLRGEATLPGHDVTAVVLGAGARGRSPVVGGPRLSQSSALLLREIQVIDEYGDHRTIHVPVERSLSVVINDQEIASLWTLGGSAEWLVLGYLWNQRLITDVTTLESITVDWRSSVATVKTRHDSHDRESWAEQLRFEEQGSSRAMLSGAPMNLDALVLSRGPPARISRATLLSLLENLPPDGAIYRAAGSAHTFALFQGAELWLSVEDTSRRNAIDTISGWMALHGTPGHNKILFTTGRLTAEIVLKAARNGIPVLVSHKGLTSMCSDLAVKLGMTLFGHAAKGRYICYVGAERFDAGC